MEACTRSQQGTALTALWSSDGLFALRRFGKRTGAVQRLVKGFITIQSATETDIRGVWDITFPHPVFKRGMSIQGRSVQECHPNLALVVVEARGAAGSPNPAIERTAPASRACRSRRTLRRRRRNDVC